MVQYLSLEGSITFARAIFGPGRPRNPIPSPEGQNIGIEGEEATEKSCLLNSSGKTM